LTFPDDALIRQLEALKEQLDAKSAALSRAIKAQETSGDLGPPNAEVLRLYREARPLLARLHRGVRQLQRQAGIPNALIEAIERSQLPPTDDRYWRTQVEEVPPSESLDEAAPRGFEQLLRVVDPRWLADQAKKPYRLADDYLAFPLHLVSGTRVGCHLDPNGPQRLARMLLVCQDHLNKRDDLDFFSAAMLVPEVAALGNSLDLVRGLGAEAERKLSQLHVMSDDMVASTVYELLVGVGCLRKGRAITMLPEDRSRKVPDFRLHDTGPIPAAIECKRRLGLTKYELSEAEHVETLYASIRPALRDAGIHGALKAKFRVPVRDVDAGSFAEHVMPLVRQDQDTDLLETPWGEAGFERLPYRGDMRLTRLYSPEYLEAAFRWNPLEDEWDGILCEVERPKSVLVREYTLPLCLKWRSDSGEALIKKTRGVLSLWADAVHQIPSGEVGFIYIAYPEGGRPAIADARTRRILEEAAGSWHRWSVRVPVTIIGRLYPRPLGCGMPDLIESALPGASRGEKFWLAKLPTLVFTASPRRLSSDAD
jgi:hypothetical protein